MPARPRSGCIDTRIGMNSSAVLSRPLEPLLSPPATSTVPSGSSVAVAYALRWVMGVFRVQNVLDQDSVLERLPPWSSPAHCPVQPPASRTEPSGSRAAVAPSRPTPSEFLVRLQLPVAGSYISEVVRATPSAPRLLPPATRTLPSGSNVAVGLSWKTFRDPVAVQRFVAGLYNSAAVVRPPAASTSPSCSRVTVANHCLDFIGPVSAQVRVAGSYTSALLPKPSPTTSTLPLGRSVPVIP